MIELIPISLGDLACVTDWSFAPFLREKSNGLDVEQSEISKQILMIF